MQNEEKTSKEAEQGKAPQKESPVLSKAKDFGVAMLGLEQTLETCKTQLKELSDKLSSYITANTEEVDLQEANNNLKKENKELKETVKKYDRSVDKLLEERKRMQEKLVAQSEKAIESIDWLQKYATIFVEEFYNTSFAMISLEFNGKSYIFAVDTGASASLLDSSISDFADCKKVGTTKSYGVDAIATKCDIIEIPFSYRGIKTPFNFSTRDLRPMRRQLHDRGVDVVGLLGSDFYAKYNFVIDYGNFLVYPKQPLKLKKKDKEVVLGNEIRIEKKTNE